MISTSPTAKGAAGSSCVSLSTGKSGAQSLRQTPAASRISGERNGLRRRQRRLVAERLQTRPACPSWLAYRHTPRSAAAASNRRPTEVVAGGNSVRAPRRRAAADRTAAPPSGHAAAALPAQASAVRQGSRAARSPPGKRNGRQLATRCQRRAGPTAPPRPRACRPDRDRGRPR